LVGLGYAGGPETFRDHSANSFRFNQSWFARYSGERTLAACWSPQSAATDFPSDCAKTIVDAIGKSVIAECDHQHSE